MLEEALRDMFAGRAEVAPVAHDAAAMAIVHARERGRRRTVIGGFAVAIALIVVVGGTFSVRSWWLPMQPAPEAQSGVLAGGGGIIQFGPVLSEAELAAQPLQLSLDVFVSSGRVAATNGAWYDLKGVGDVLTVVRVPLGWVYGGVDRVRLLRTDGTAVDLLDRAMPWLVSPHGDQIVAVTGRSLKLWPLSTHGLGTPITATVPTGVVPTAFVGDRVVLRNPEGRFDYWQPQDAFRPTWTVSLNAIYDSPTLDTYGLISGAHQCLVRVRAEQGLQLGSALGCGSTLDTAQLRAVASPDGRLLAVPTARGLNILDLAGSRATPSAQAAGEPAVAATCEADSGTTPVWSAMDTVITTSAGGLVACSVDGPRRPVKLPAGVMTTDLRLIPIRA